MKTLIENVAESQVGYKNKENSKHIGDPEIERMSKEQKDLRLQIVKYQNHEQIKQLRKSRKKILKQMSHKIKDPKEKLADDLVGEIENAKMTQECSKQQKFYTLNTKQSSLCITNWDNVYHNHKRFRKNSRNI